MASRATLNPVRWSAHLIVGLPAGYYKTQRAIGNACQLADRENWELGTDERGDRSRRKTNFGENNLVAREFSLILPNGS